MTDGPGKKHLGTVQFSTLDPLAIQALAEHGGKGARKYARHNFLRGYEWSASIDALTRHLLAFLAGEDVDAETGSLHMTAVMWHAHALVGFQARGIGTDDRAPTAKQPLMKLTAPTFMFAGRRISTGAHVPENL